MNDGTAMPDCPGCERTVRVRLRDEEVERLLADCARIDRISKGRADGDAWVELERLVVGIAAPRALAR